MAEHRDMRASDADRANIAERLRRALDEGRLSVDEFDERLGQVLEARTYGELSVLIADLPRERHPARRRRRVWTALRPRRAKRPGRAVAVLCSPRTLVAGALATVAVAVPLTVTEVGASGPPLPGAPWSADAGTCTNHWTKTSVVLPCDWGKIVSQADAPQIANDVVKASEVQSRVLRYKGG